MSWLTDTIAGRTIVVLVLGLGSILAAAQYLYQRGIEHEVTARNTAAVVERLLVLSDTIMAIEPERRDRAAHRLSGGPLELHWGREPLATPGGYLDRVAARLRDGLVARSPALRDKGLVIGTNRTSDQTHEPGKPVDAYHTTLLSLPLADGTWLNVTLARVEATRAAAPSALLSAVFGALGVVLVAVLMSQWLTRPLQRLADGARSLFQTSANADLPATGTREVRTLATAVNELQHRIRRLVDERTHMLAAVSHDLRTPLTRLRLRIARIEDPKVRRSIEADLDEMEAMIAATLAFLRDDQSSEDIEMVDLAAILDSIAADATDIGESVVVSGPRHVVVPGRHLALKRALTNLVQNAVKYGGSATVILDNTEDEVVIRIADEGPGLPADQIEALFEPFARGEPSRGRQTGGYGLGLTVARTILRTHGGDVTLDNRVPKGLLARVRLPAKPAAALQATKTSRAPR